MMLWSVVMDRYEGEREKGEGEGSRGKKDGFNLFLTGKESLTVIAVTPRPRSTRRRRYYHQAR